MKQILLVFHMKESSATMSGGYFSALQHLGNKLKAVIHTHYPALDNIGMQSRLFPGKKSLSVYSTLSFPLLKHFKHFFGYSIQWDFWSLLSQVLSFFPPFSINCLSWKHLKYFPVPCHACLGLFQIW